MNKIAEAEEIFFVNGTFKGMNPYPEVANWVRGHIKEQAKFFCISPLGHIGNPCVFCEQTIEQETSEEEIAQSRKLEFNQGLGTIKLRGKR